MENEQKKNELGTIYGSRISKSGKWLNLLIVTHTDGHEVRITCPVRLEQFKDESKPFACLESCNSTAKIYNLPIYTDKKPTEEQAAAEDSDLPF